MYTPWLNHYPPDVPNEIEPTDATLVDVFLKSCTTYANQPAYTCLGTTLTYAELETKSRHFAAYLRHELKLAAGERVALMMPNLLQYPVALFGVLRAGLVAVNVNPLYTSRELQHQLTDADVGTIVIIENFAASLAKVVNNVPIKHIITAQVGDCLPVPKRWLVNFVVKHVKKQIPAFSLPATTHWSTALQQGKKHHFTPPDIQADDLAFLQYTGGTTGRAKGVQLLHRNIVANILQCSAWLEGYLYPGEERAITALPLYHVFALTANCLVFLRYGGHNYLVPDARNIDDLVNTFNKHRPTAFTGVNTLFNALIHHKQFKTLNFEDLHIALGGGAAIQEAVAKRWKKITGQPIIEAYGLTETSPAAILNPMDIREYNHSIGQPIPSTLAAIRDDDGQDLPVGVAGELCLAGPQVTPGYWRQPEENKNSFFADGFFKTGDIAKMDNKGFFTIVDRKKDMINVSGFNVFPNEIEAVVADHPGVLEVGCIGQPDEKSGEAIKLFIVKKNPNLTTDKMIDYCRERLTAYKVPKHIEFIDQLPKSNVGKVLRRKLQELNTQKNPDLH